MTAETLTDGMRRRLREHIAVCPTCHRPLEGEGVRPVAERMGIPHSNLWRFLQGRTPSAATLDAVAAYLAEETP